MDEEIQIRKFVMPNGDIYVSVDDFVKYVDSLPSDWGNRMSAAIKHWIKDVLNHIYVEDIQ